MPEAVIVATGRSPIGRAGKGSLVDVRPDDMLGHIVKNVLAKIPELIRVYAKTFHFVGNSAYDIADGRATGEVYCLAHHLTPDRHGGTNYVMYIRYQDRYHPGPDGVWKIADRRVLIDWTEVRPANTAGR